MRSSHVLAISAAVLLMLAPLAVWSYWQWNVVEVEHVPMRVQVLDSPVLGFDVNDTDLVFGSISQGGWSERRAWVSAAYPAKIVVRIHGDLADWTVVSQNRFPLVPGEPQDIVFVVTAPRDAEPGNYTGTAVIEYRRR